MTHFREWDVCPPLAPSPAALWRIATRAPYPAITIELPCNLGRQRVRAVSSRTLGEVLDAEDQASALIYESLKGELGRGFDSADEIAAVLTEREVTAVAAVIASAHSTLSVISGFSDLRAWERVLANGAQAPENRLDSLALSQCVEAVGTNIVPRPERFWGVAPCQLVDTQWLAFRVARKAYSDSRR